MRSFEFLRPHDRARQISKSSETFMYKNLLFFLSWGFCDADGESCFAADSKAAAGLKHCNDIL